MKETERNIKISLYKKEMPISIKGAVSENGSDDYIILVNSLLSETEQAAAFLHECLHIYNQDSEKQCNINTIESNTHEQLRSIAHIWESE